MKPIKLLARMTNRRQHNGLRLNSKAITRIARAKAGEPISGPLDERRSRRWGVAGELVATLSSGFSAAPINTCTSSPATIRTLPTARSGTAACRTLRLETVFTDKAWGTDAPFSSPHLPQCRSLDRADTKLRDHGTQPARFFGQRIGGRIRFLDHGGILLGYKGRARIEQPVSKLKRFKRVALRREKTKRNFCVAYDFWRRFGRFVKIFRDVTDAGAPCGRVTSFLHILTGKVPAPAGAAPPYRRNPSTRPGNATA